MPCQDKTKRTVDRGAGTMTKAREVRGGRRGCVALYAPIQKKDTVVDGPPNGSSRAVLAPKRFLWDNNSVRFPLI